MASPVEYGVVWFLIALLLIMGLGFYAGLTVALACLLLLLMWIFRDGSANVLIGTLAALLALVIVLGLVISPWQGFSLLVCAGAGFLVGWLFCVKGLW
jgi:hypothetical protein